MFQSLGWLMPLPRCGQQPSFLEAGGLAWKPSREMVPRRISVSDQWAMSFHPSGAYFFFFRLHKNPWSDSLHFALDLNKTVWTDSTANEPLLFANLGWPLAMTDLDRPFFMSASYGSRVILLGALSHPTSLAEKFEFEPDFCILCAKRLSICVGLLLETCG